jgi:hypothetical protein
MGKKRTGRNDPLKLVEKIPLENRNLYLRIYKQYRTIENEVKGYPREYNEIVVNIAALEKRSLLTTRQGSAMISYLEESLLRNNPGIIYLGIHNGLYRLSKGMNCKRGTPGDPALHFLVYALKEDLSYYSRSKQPWNSISEYLKREDIGDYSGDTLRKKGKVGEIVRQLSFVLITLADSITATEFKTLKRIFPSLNPFCIRKPE